MARANSPLCFVAYALAALAPCWHGVCADDAHPWPTWQRTPSRLGRALAVGPQTPTIAWTLPVDPTLNDAPLYEFAGVLDAAGRLFVGHSRGLAAVDTANHEILWQFQDAASVLSAPSLYADVVLFGSTNDFFYCVDAATGAEVWKQPALPHPNRSCVVSDSGVVYYVSQIDAVYARRVADGSEVWTRTFGDFFRSPPSLDGTGALFLPTLQSLEWLALTEAAGETLWTSPLPSDGFGLSCFENATVYVASRRHLHALDSTTGNERWFFDTGVINGGVAAIRDDGVVYIEASNFATGFLYAISPAGEEQWRYEFANQSIGMPGIVDERGTFYFCTHDNVNVGYLHAIQPDGSPLFVAQMPHLVSSSPTLATDGTLFVMCGDKQLYAFKDPPPCPSDIDGSGLVDFADLLALLSVWGPCEHPSDCPEDLDGSGIVDFADLVILLAAWGPCP